MNSEGGLLLKVQPLVTRPNISLAGLEDFYILNENATFNVSSDPVLTANDLDSYCGLLRALLCLKGFLQAWVN